MKKPILSTAAVCLTLAYGCHKGSSEGPGISGSTRAFIDQQRSQAEQNFQVNAVSGGTVIGSHGTVIAVQPHAFVDHQGAPVNGLVTIKVMDAYALGDMTLLNMRTVARNGSGRMALQSGGEVRVRAEAAGEQVTVLPGQVTVHFPAQSLDPAMRAWHGEEDPDGNVLWDQQEELGMDQQLVVHDENGDTICMSGSFYSIPWPIYGDPSWPPYAYINCDQVLPPEGDSTDVVIVPAGYSDATVWLVFPSINCMVYMEGYQGGGRSAGLPVTVGLQGTIVALAIDPDGTYHASFTPITVTQGHHQTVPMQTMTEAEYTQQLQAL